MYLMKSYVLRGCGVKGLAQRPVPTRGRQPYPYQNRGSQYKNTVVHGDREMVCRSAAARVMAASSSSSTMKVRIQGRHMEATPAIKEFIEEKVTKALANFDGAVKEVDVTISASGNHGKGSEAHHQRHQKAEVTVYTLRHGVVRVEDMEDDLYAAVDLVMDKLKRKMSKLKEKAIQRNTWPGRGGTKGGAGIEDVLPNESLDEDDLPIDATAPETAPEIVREKILLLSDSMTPECAVEQLESVGHDFFVFVDSKDGQMKVVYKRLHHGYGLIIPQLDA